MQFISLILLLILNIYSDASQRNTEEFDWSLTKEVLNNECSTGQNICNVILSPFVTKHSLSLLKRAIAANSESDKELSILLPKLSEYDEWEYWQKTLEPLWEKNENNSVLMGSLIGLAKGASIDSSYELEALYIFNAEVKTYDFDRRDETVKTLNDDASSKTEGHVKDIVTTDLIDGGQAIILNTIYFKAEWEIRFEKTFTDTYLNNDNKTYGLHYMEAIGKFYSTKSETLDSLLVRINYKGGKYAMIYIQPKEGDGLENIINNLDVYTLQNEISKMVENPGTITIPKFKFESSFSMAKHIKNLGNTKIFTPEANIQKINSSGPAFEVKDVVQKFAIEVNEVGTEAYGVMDMGIMNKMDKRAKSINTTTINPPFLFCIMDVTTGVVHFSGKVLKFEHSN